MIVEAYRYVLDLLTMDMLGVFKGTPRRYGDYRRTIALAIAVKEKKNKKDSLYNLYKE